MEFNTIDFDGSHCFLCCEPLRSDNRTDEHIFPKWLQKKHNLWNQKLELLNGTKIQYRNLVIPCCSCCNNGVLSALEIKVRAIFEKHPRQLDGIDRKWMYLWSAKILFGLLAKERGLLIDRANPNDGTIIDRSDLDRLRAIHSHLQAIRFEHKFNGPNGNDLGSVVMLSTKEHSKLEKNFDFADDYIAFSLFLRTGSRALYVNFDGGLVAASIGHLMERDAPRPLHPVQAKELWAKFMYKTQLVLVIPFFLVRFDSETRMLEVLIMSYDESDNLSKMVVIESGESRTAFAVAPLPRSDDWFRDWDETEFGYKLSELLGMDPVNIFVDSERTKVGTFIWKEDLTFWDIEFD